MRAMLKPCSPSGKAQPRIRSSIASGSTLVSVTSALTTSATRSSGRTRRRSPLLARWNGDRLKPAMTTLLSMVISGSSAFLVAGRTRGWVPDGSAFRQRPFPLQEIDDLGLDALQVGDGLLHVDQLGLERGP